MHILLKKREFRVNFRVMRNRALTVHCIPDKDPSDKSNIKEYLLQEEITERKEGKRKHFQKKRERIKVLLRRKSMCFFSRFFCPKLKTIP